MPSPKKKFTSAQRAARKRRKKETEIIFINGKQKRIKREPTLDGMKHFLVDSGSDPPSGSEE